MPACVLSVQVWQLLLCYALCDVGVPQWLCSTQKHAISDVCILQHMMRVKPVQGTRHLGEQLTAPVPLGRCKQPELLHCAVQEAITARWLFPFGTESVC
jgi:hypothetical protein